MRPHFEFNFFPIAAGEVERGVEPALALLGSQGWEIRAMCAAADGSLTVALQRPLDEEPPLADARALAETLALPLVAPGE